MTGSLVDILIFAPLAPISGVILFWFLQLLFIESEKYFLSQIREKHIAFCRFTNFLGVFFQTICHALGYTVTGSGISEFYLSVHYGKVSPKRRREGFFEWFSNGFLFIGPFFIPSALLLLTLFFLIPEGFNFTIQQEYTFSESLINFGANLYTFSKSFIGFLVSIDLFHPAHIGFCILFLLIGLGIRPSYIKEEKREEKIDMLYDLKNIKNYLLHKPMYVLIFFIASYIFFYISFLLDVNWYLAFFSILGWLSIIAIISILITHLLIFMIKITDKIQSIWRYVPYIIIILSYIGMRILFLFIHIEYSRTLSILGMFIITIIGTWVILKRETNKFKTIGDMEILRDLDGSR